ncbi:hypothetical protein BZA05DRAFT_163694 [Tricharina praecox]|uniref:uncharacterized protein n=1 Tax=Tricharina praecox TaxID=43433 RepID=UPI00221FAF64|nr:uncharacterized protein BZA05DRAFT_163694 [Tricharina praecox]KAI5856986.1 hypothetical protein BZA05DRAFT_163694 [Tricharina praecox]
MSQLLNVSTSQRLKFSSNLHFRRSFAAIHLSSLSLFLPPSLSPPTDTQTISLWSSASLRTHSTSLSTNHTLPTHLQDVSSRESSQDSQAAVQCLKEAVATAATGNHERPRVQGRVRITPRPHAQTRLTGIPLPASSRTPCCLPSVMVRGVMKKSTISVGSFS